MFYGWKIVGAAFVTLFISVGFLFYSFSALFTALTPEFGGSRFATAVALAVMNATVGVCSPFLGRILDSYSIRNVMLYGAVCLTAGFMLASRATALWQIYVIFATLLGLGAAMVGQLPSSTLVANWFVRRRGTALGIATMGISMSGVVMAPLTMWLIQQFGWRGTFVTFATVTVLLVMPLVYMLVVSRPEDLDMLPDGGPATLHDPSMSNGPNPTSLPEPEKQWRAAETLRDRNFWIITAVIALNFFSMGAILTHSIQHGIDLGVSELRAPFILSVCAGVGVGGKVLFGYIADHIQTRSAMWLSIIFQVSGTGVLLVAETYGPLLLAGALFGLGMGGIVPLWGSLVGEHYGRRSFGRVMGLMTPCMMPGQITGVPFAGYLYDRTGSYTGAFITFLCVYTVAAVLLLLLKHRPVEPK